MASASSRPARPLASARERRARLISASVTALLALLIAWVAWRFLAWAVWHAVWSVPTGPDGAPNTDACRAALGEGACWAVIGEKYRFILFGFYPYAEQWRPALVVLLFIGLFAASLFRRFWHPSLFVVWAGTLVFSAALMWGGFAGLPFVPADQWGGLPITLFLATVGLALAFPLAILAALARASRGLPLLKGLSILYIELIRGVPLISLLFMASVMLPLFLPPGIEIAKLLRAQIAFILFAGAYLAEVVRAGLAALPKGQYEAASALGLSYWQSMRHVILPQALRHTVPMLVNTFVGFFKDTSLVLVIGIYDVMTTARTAILEPRWQGFGIEVYLFLAVIYFAFCYSMAGASRRLESRSATPLTATEEPA
jgi:general L-amino acid transport system permease protein